jgi:hypothetical protein
MSTDDLTSHQPEPEPPPNLGIQTIINTLAEESIVASTSTHYIPSIFPDTIPDEIPLTRTLTTTQPTVTSQMTTESAAPSTHSLQQPYKHNCLHTIRLMHRAMYNPIPLQKHIQLPI